MFYDNGVSAVLCKIAALRPEIPLILEKNVENQKNWTWVAIRKFTSDPA